MDESDKLDAFIRGIDPLKAKRPRSTSPFMKGDFGSMLDAIKNDMKVEEPVKKPLEKWGTTDIYKRGD